MAAMSPTARESVVVKRPDITGSKPMRFVITGVLVGVLLAGFDICFDSVFLGGALWSRIAETDSYASQDQMFLPYIGLAVRLMIYGLVSYEVWRDRKSISSRSSSMEHDWHRLANVMLLCAVGSLVNMAVTITVFVQTSYEVSGMRDETLWRQILGVFTGDATLLLWLGTASVVIDIVLLALAASVAVILRTSRARQLLD